ncbi:MAG: hypothetical protein JNM86_09880 [Phycisphaerae bacterium]|nr:hypothetical protein [Phycisphaerae bacterium]MBN8597733.1 hypothetical protein [Planctomycetota bacterium]
MQSEPVVIREKTWKYWLIGGTMIAPGADRFWKLHGYTRRRRAGLFGMLGMLGAGLPLFLILFPPATLGWGKHGFAMMGFWMVLPGLVVYLALRLLLLPMFVYGAWMASRIRRADGRVCWECGKDVGEGAEGTCGCGENWKADALRLFWIACGLLPATVRGVREARFAVGGELEPPAVSFVARLFSGLPRDQLSAWQERPLTLKWLKSAQWRGGAISMLPFAVLVLATALLAGTLKDGRLWIFVSGMIVLGAGAVVGQFAILRWNLRRAVKLARENVRNADGLICTDCGFVLRGLAEKDRCPECGIEFRADEVRGFFRASGILEAGK